MAKALSGIAIFSTEQYGFDKEQVGHHLMEIQQKYERLRKVNFYLKIGAISCAVICATFLVWILAVK